MNKLSVARTIVGAYEFAFTHLGTIIGLIWLPLVLATLLNFLPALSDKLVANNPAAVGTQFVESLAVLLLTLLLYSIIYVAVTRQALGLRQGPAMVHFSLGLPEFRVFGVLVLVYYVIGVFAYAATLAQAASGPAAPAAGVLTLVGVLILVYLVIRLGFVMVPVIVAEGRVDFARSWSITRGNFWRIVLVLLAIGVPVAVIWLAGAMAVMGKDLAAVLPATPAADPQAMQQQMAAIRAVVDRHWSELMGISLILAPFDLGLSLSASAIGYRGLANGSGIRDANA